MIDVDIQPAAQAGPPPTRLECKLYADRFGCDLPEDLHSENGTCVLRASAYLFGCRDSAKNVR